MHLAAALLLALALPSTPPAPRPEAVIRLTPHRTRWKLPVRVGDRVVFFGFDSGGGVTVISPETARALGCTPWGAIDGSNMFGQRMASPRCDGVTLDLGSTRVTPPVSTVTPMDSLNPGDSTLAGSLALDAFEGRAVTMDLGMGVLVVESPGSLAARVRTMRPLPVRIQHELGGRATSVFVAVPTPKGAVWMEMDSGNGGTVLVSKPYAALMGLDPAAPGPQRGSIDVLPGVRVETDHMFTANMIVDGNLGMPFLRRWVVTVDLARGRAWIAPSAGSGPARDDGALPPR